MLYDLVNGAKVTKVELKAFVEPIPTTRQDVVICVHMHLTTMEKYNCNSAYVEHPAFPFVGQDPILVSLSFAARDWIM